MLILSLYLTHVIEHMTKSILHIILVVVVLAAGILINVLYEWILTSFGVGPSAPLPPEFTEGAVNMAIFAALAICVAPFAEETFFRGFVFSGVGKRFGYVWGAVFSALLFAFIHVLAS